MDKDTKIGKIIAANLVLGMIVATSFWAQPAMAETDTEKADILYQQGNFADAFDLWETAAQGGDPIAQFNLATLYETGRGVDSDLVKARKLLTQSANSNYAPALHNLALITFEENMPDKALGYLQKAAAQKFTASLYTLGKFHQFGIAGERKPELAFQYVGMAAQAGHDGAQYNLGKMYRDGFGIDKSEAESFNWFLRAAAQGNKKAQSKVATRYADGMGISEDKVLALKWTLIAGAAHSKEASDLENQLLGELSTSQIEQAKEKVRGFAAKKENSIK